MLSNVDVVISFAAIMLGVSMLVMVGTQSISAVLNLRGAQLSTGLQQLLVKAELDASKAAAVTERILMDPLLSDGVVWRRLAPAIQQREFTAMLALLKTEQSFKAEATKLEGAIRFSEQWFGAAMDRVSHRFAGIMRGATIVLSFVFAFALHLDTLSLLSNLSSNAELRQSLVVSAQALEQRAESALSAPAVSSPPATLETAKGLIAQAKGIQAELGKSQFQLIPSPYPGLDFSGHWLGVIASAVLLSLGAPFWFNVLRSASSLRPAIAQKVDDAEKDSEKEKLPSSA